MEIAAKPHTSSRQNSEKTSCKSYLTSKQSKHIFFQLSRLISGKTLQNNSSASNSNEKFGQKSQARA